MQSSIIRLTEFREQELKCIGGDGRATPYQITTSAGRVLGRIEQIIPASEIAPANGRLHQPGLSMLRRLATFFN